MSGKLASFDFAKIFSLAELQNTLETLENKEYESVKELPRKSSFPDFGAHILHQTALAHVCEELGEHIDAALSAVRDVPSSIIAKRMCLVWDSVLASCLTEFYSDSNLCRVVKNLQKDEESVGTSVSTSEVLVSKRVSQEKLTGNALLMEVGIKTGLAVVFSLLKQAWSQMSWQRRLEQALLPSSSLPLEESPDISLPNSVLKMVLDMLVDIPPLSLSNAKTISQFGESCLTQSLEFLQWVLSPQSQVDLEGKRLALQIMVCLYVQRGSLVHFLEWVETALVLIESYQNVGENALPPYLEVEFCQSVLLEIRTRTVSDTVNCWLVTIGRHTPLNVCCSFAQQIGCRSCSRSEQECFPPESLTESGHVRLMDFLHVLVKEVSFRKCTTPT